MNKKIKKIKQLNFAQQMPGFRATGVMHSEFETDPFLIFGEFYNDRSVFGPHPHAGVSVMTYILPDSIGSFLNRDSLGDRSIIDPGGMHVSQTGTGIFHDELPETVGIECHAFQIWINHSEKDRFAEPKSFHLSSKEVPVWLNDNMSLRVLLGSYQTLISPVELLTQTLLFDVTLQANSSVEFHTQQMAFVYLISGGIHIDGQEVNARGVVTFEEKGDKIMISTADEPANFMLASGTPFKEPMVNGGHFVMTTQKQMQATSARLQRGEMGHLSVV
ncbi:MAG: pirin-like C-terminal cupin domain-containing protein [Bacteroidota bacterium]